VDMQNLADLRPSLLREIGHVEVLKLMQKLKVSHLNPFLLDAPPAF